MVVVPSATIDTEAELPVTVKGPPFWLPLSEYTIDRTPLPPALSAAFSVTVTSLLFHPAALAAGDGVATVAGGVVSGVILMTAVSDGSKASFVLSWVPP